MAEVKAGTLDLLDEQISELQARRDEDKEVLRALIAEREKFVAGAIWADKISGMNEAEIEAIQEAISNRDSNAQQVGVSGIVSEEDVNGQSITQ